MIDVLKAGHQFYRKREPKMDTNTCFKSGIHLEDNPILTCCAKRSSALNHYVCILKCLLCLMLTILRHMMRSCECKEKDTGGIQKCLDNRCVNNEREHRQNKGYTGKVACSDIYSLRNRPENCSAKEALKDSSNSEPGSSKFHTDSYTFDPLCITNTITDSDSLVLPANSNASHKYLKTQESRIQHSLGQCSTVKHIDEIKRASEVQQTGLGNTSNNASTKVHDQKRESKHPSSNASMSTYKTELDSKHGVHQTESNGENWLDIDNLPNADSDSIGSASLETDDSFCWQETDDPVASITANQNLKNKLMKIFQSPNLGKRCGATETASFSQFADTLSNDSDKPIQNNSVMHSEKDTNVQKVIQINTALAGNFTKNDGITAELLNREFISKKDKYLRDTPNHCCSNILRGAFNDQCNGNAIASNVFSDLYHMNCDIGRNHYYADKVPLSTSEFVCLENTKIMHEVMQLNNEEELFSNPMPMDEHNDGIVIVSLKGVEVESCRTEGVGDQEITQNVVPDSETEEAEAAENAAREGEEVDDGRGTAGEEEGEEGGEGEEGSEQGGEGGEEGADGGEGNDYIMIMMRGFLGPSIDEAILDLLDASKRIYEFIKGSVLQEGGGGSDEGGEGDESGGEKGGTEKGGADEGGQEGSARASEQGGARASEKGGARASEQGGERASEQGGTRASEQGGARASEQGGERASERGSTAGGQEGGAEGGEEGGTEDDNPQQGEEKPPEEEEEEEEDEEERATLTYTGS